MRSMQRSLRQEGVLLAALGVIFLLPLSPTLAQDSSDDVPTIRQSDVIVSVMGDGSEVKAAGATVLIQGQATNIRAAGANVTVRATANGDVSLAGAQVQFGGDVGGDLVMVGATVDARGQVGKDVKIASAVIVLNAIVDGSAYLGGATVTVGSGSDISGDLKIAAANVTISGHVAGQTDVAAGLVTINAQTDGSVIARAAQVVVNAPARISGDLTVYSLNEPVIAEGAVVSGRVTRITPPDWWDQWTGANWWWWKIGIAGLMAIGTILAGLVLLIFASGVFVVATDNVRHRPVTSFLFGILAAVLIPFIAVVLMATIAGISVGIAVLFVLPILIVFGHAMAAAGIASGVLIRRHGELGAGVGFLMLVAGAIILAAIGIIPYAGPLLVTIAIILGTGALARSLGARIRRGGEAVAAV